MTDVNIAMQMFSGRYKDEYDVAILISGDSDLIPPIKAVQTNFNKRVVVVFPPNRHNASVKQIANGAMVLGRRMLKKSQFENKIKLEGGYEITKPSQW